MMHLPEIATKHLAIKIRAKAEKTVYNKHPWIFSDSITKENIDGNTGDIAIIYSQKKNSFLALGLYDADSPIRIKILQFSNPAKIDENWFKTKIEHAFEKRKKLLQSRTNAYRLLYGESDSFPGFIADVYADVLVIKLYSSIWFPYLKQIIPSLMSTSHCKTLVLRLSRQLQEKDLYREYNLYDGSVLYGELIDEVVVFKEHGISFSANVVKGHKTGYFLDHRHNRKKVGELSKNKSLLDVFSYAGGFTVHALSKGAKEVTSLDISAQALEMARRNVALNKHSGKHNILKSNAFEGLENLKEKKKSYDIVVIDPPSFAKKQSEIEGAKNSYRKLSKLGIELVGKNGILVIASCSSRIGSTEFFSIVEESLKKSKRRYQCIEKTFHDIDHPIDFPEASYLKCGYYQLDV